MKFRCGPTLIQRLKARKARLENWHRWFAWRPVRIDDGACVWLQVVDRKGIWLCYYGCAWMWEYRT